MPRRAPRGGTAAWHGRTMRRRVADLTRRLLQILCNDPAAQAGKSSDALQGAPSRAGKAVPGKTVPDTTVPDTTVPDTTVPDTTVPDTTVSDTTVMDENLGNH
jgi:hypothetical protein